MEVFRMREFIDPEMELVEVGEDVVVTSELYYCPGHFYVLDGIPHE